MIKKVLSNIVNRLVLSFIYSLIRTVFLARNFAIVRIGFLVIRTYIILYVHFRIRLWVVVRELFTILFLINFLIRWALFLRNGFHLIFLSHFRCQVITRLGLIINWLILTKIIDILWWWILGMLQVWLFLGRRWLALILIILTHGIFIRWITSISFLDRPLLVHDLLLV
jgi:hypothetical protein